MDDVWSRAALAALVISAVVAPSAGATASPAKAHFVAAANRECSTAITRFKQLSHLPRGKLRVQRGLAELNRTIGAIAHLTPPKGDERRVARIVVLFRRFSVTLTRLTQAKKADATAAASAVMLARTKVAQAAQAYGLTTCVKLLA